ncbi:MAG: glucuronate isomerase, partial [Oceanicoccus sp.]
MTSSLLHPDRLFSSDERQRSIARTLYNEVRNLPIVSPHGHTDASWFSGNKAFDDASSLLIQPDHYLFRMLYSQGVALESLGVGAMADNRKVWQIFADHYHLFQGTPSRMWFDHALVTVFDIDERLNSKNANKLYDQINACLQLPDFSPRALFDRFNIEVLATTESPLDNLCHHDAIAQSGWTGQVVTTYRPDPVVDPDYEGFVDNIAELGALTGHDVSNWQGYLSAHTVRRGYFIERGATATDHGHPSAMTADLSTIECESLYTKVLSSDHSPGEAELFRAQMLTQMAEMSLNDGLIMQIHPGVHRNHN